MLVVGTILASGIWFASWSVAALAHATPIRRVAAVPACSESTARQLVDANGLNGFLLADPVDQLLCGPFTGPGSEAMAMTIGPAPTCWRNQSWAVFAFTGGTWQLAMSRSEFVYRPIVAVGGDLKVTRPIHRSGDPRCLPSGGRRITTWHWNGTGFVVSASKVIATPPPVKHGYFKTPSANIVCEHVPTPSGVSVGCGIRSGLKPPPAPKPCAEGAPTADRVFVSTTGRVVVPSCSGDEGPFRGLHVAARVLRYGTAWTGGGVRCVSQLKGLTCTNRSGHGFVLSRAQWRRF
jgi:hypothetical protein